MAKTNPLDVTPFDAAEYLKDELGIAAFLNASREMNDPAVLLNALATVARARSMTELAEASGLGRESLYKALRPGAQPRYDTVMRVMDALGVEMVFQAKRPAPRVKQSTVKPASPAGTKRVSAQPAPPKSAPKDSRKRNSQARATATGKELTRPARGSSPRER